MTRTFMIQNVDRIIRPKDYAHLEESGDLLVTGAFHTLQGEQPYGGWPAVFVRLAGCNFGNKSLDSACAWCDSAFQFDQGRRWDQQALLEHLVGMKRHPNDILVITGGEPTLQHNLISFIELIQNKCAFNTIQIETNGTQASWFSKLYNSNISCSHAIDYPGFFVVTSPKGVYKAGVIPKPSDVVLEYTGALKFVIENEPGPHFTVPSWVQECSDSGVYCGPVYVSPMAVYKKPYTGEVSSIWDQDLIDYEKTSRNYVYAAQYAMENGYRLSVQSHLFTAIA